MSDESEQQYLNLKIGSDLEYDTNLNTLEEMVFWLEAFKSVLIDRIFDAPEE